MNLTPGTQAVIDDALRNLSLVQYALTDRSVDLTHTNRAEAERLADESDAIRQAVRQIRSALRTASQDGE